MERGLEEHLSHFDDYFFTEAFFRPLADFFGSISDDHDISYHTYLQPAFWEKLTGDPDFYIKLIDLVEDYPQEYRLQFEEESARATNRFDLVF